MLNYFKFRVVEVVFRLKTALAMTKVKELCLELVKWVSISARGEAAVLLFFFGKGGEGGGRRSHTCLARLLRQRAPWNYPLIFTAL